MAEDRTPFLLAGIGLLAFAGYAAFKSRGPTGAAGLAGVAGPPGVAGPTGPAYMGGPPPGAYQSGTQPTGPGAPSASLPQAGSPYPIGLAATGAPTLLVYRQPPQPVAGVGQQGSGAGAIIQRYPPRPPSRITILTPGMRTPLVLPLPTALSVTTAGIRRQGRPY